MQRNEEVTEDDIVCRRSITDDAIHINLLIGEAFFIYNKRYGSYYNVKKIIESSFLSITALNKQGDIVGFGAFSDSPVLDDEVWVDWPNYLRNCYGEGYRYTIGNSIWFRFFTSLQNYQDPVINSIFRTLYVTLPDIDYTLFALPAVSSTFSPIQEYFTPIKTNVEYTLNKSKNLPYFDGTVYVSPRQDVVPDLTVRKGKVEDFDDLMPLLITGNGVLTEMGDEFFLDELLEKQDEHNAALVALDSETGAIVGLMCLRSAVEDQQFILRTFVCDPYQKLKKLRPSTDPKVKDSKSNTFQITFFYLNPDYECRACDFLFPIFDVFPHAEYCFIRLLHSVPDHQLLSHFRYVPLKQGSTQKLGCFLLCRYALEKSNLHVSKAVQSDIAGISTMLKSQTQRSAVECERITSMATECTGDRPPLRERTAVMIHNDMVVGVMVTQDMTTIEVSQMCTEFDIAAKVDVHAIDIEAGEELYRQTSLEQNTQYQQLQFRAIAVKHFFVRPQFACWARLFLREVLRYTKAELVFYMTGLGDEVSRTLCAELIFALPRKTTGAHTPIRQTDQSERNPLIAMQNAHRAESTQIQPRDVVLHFTSRKLLSDIKHRIHSRVVVIGASSTGLSFVFSLLSLYYLHFTNIVLISKDGIMEHPNHSELMWFTDTLDFVTREYILFKLPGKVRIVEGTMVDFERTDKYVVTDNNLIEPYDYLILTAGRQYSLPRELGSAKTVAKNGVFVLSSLSMINKLKQYVTESEMYEDSFMKAVVYGSNLDAYCALTSLLRMGIKESRIVLVSPDPATESPFHDSEIQQKVDRLCDNHNIRIFKHHELERMEYNDDNNLTAIYVWNRSPGFQGANATDTHDQNRLVEIPCWLFVYCHEKDIDTSILSALNKRSIVFDGRVIVENNYRTTDRLVYAAGPIAMFSRRFGPSEPFESYRSVEIGKHLSCVVLGHLGIEEFKSYAEDDSELMSIDHEALRRERQGQLFAADATSQSQSQTQNQGQEVIALARPRPLPVYTSNLMWTVHLPGSFRYFHCMTRNCTPDTVSKGINISTQDDEGNNFIRVSVNTNNYIQSISYFSSKDGDIHNYKVFVGIPQTTLNLLQRWNDKLISDIVVYFQESWVKAVYFDKFNDFMNNLKIRIRKQKDVQILHHTILDFVQQEKLDRIDERQRRVYASELSEETRHIIELELIKFLQLNKHFLPGFFLPDITAYVN